MRLRSAPQRRGAFVASPRLRSATDRITRELCCCRVLVLYSSECLAPAARRGAAPLGSLTKIARVRYNTIQYKVVLVLVLVLYCTVNLLYCAVLCCALLVAGSRGDRFGSRVFTR